MSGSVVLSQTSNRAALVSVLTGLEIPWDGRTWTLTGYPWEPAPVSPLDAWPVWERTEWPARFGTVHGTAVDWSVYVALPTQVPAPVALGDLVADIAGSALVSLGQIGQAEPVALTLDTGQPPTFAVRIGITI